MNNKNPDMNHELYSLYLLYATLVITGNLEHVIVRLIGRIEMFDNAMSFE